MSRVSIVVDGVTVVVDGNGVEVIAIGGRKVLLPIPRHVLHDAKPKPIAGGRAPMQIKPPAKTAKPKPKKKPKPLVPSPQALGRAINEAADAAIAGLRAEKKAGKGKPQGAAPNGAAPSTEPSP